MEIKYYEYSNYKIYNLKTNEYIIYNEEEEANEDAKSLIACWASEVFDEPIIKDENLKTSWAEYVSKYKLENESDSPWFDELKDFLKKYENPNWIVIENRTNGIACGPVSSNLILVVDKDVVINEIELPL